MSSATVSPRSDEPLLARLNGADDIADISNPGAQPGRHAEPLDPANDAARIRAFFVHPDRSRRGLVPMHKSLQ